MKNWIRVLLPVGLGLLAGLLNFAAIHHKVAPETFVTVSRDIQFGEPLAEGESDLQQLTLSGDVDLLKTSAVLWKDRYILLKKRAPRKLRKGDLLLFQDALQSTELEPGDGEVSLPVSIERIPNVPRLLLVGEEIGFLVARPRSAPTSSSALPITSEPDVDPEYVGPFRLLSVGDRLSRTQSDEVQPDGSSPDSGVIHIGIRLNEGSNELEDSSRRLVAAQAANVYGRSGILAIVMHKTRRKEQHTPDTTGANGALSESNEASEMDN